MRQEIERVFVYTASDAEGRVSTAKVNVYVGTNRIYEAIGSSKCSGPDKFDSALGEQLAVSRALKKLAKDLEKSVRKEVDRRDKIRDNQLATAAKSLAARKARGVAFLEERAKATPIATVPVTWVPGESKSFVSTRAGSISSGPQGPVGVVGLADGVVSRADAGLG